MLVTSGDNSRQGEVSLEDAVLEPPPVEFKMPIFEDLVPI